MKPKGKDPSQISSKRPMILLIGPSGVGKSSFLDKALVDFPVLRDTITYTTRAMRKGESQGQPYHFVTRERFNELLKQDFFVEHAEVHGNLYGTPRDQIEESWRLGRVVIMDIDVQGAKIFKAQYPQALAIFVVPPSIDALRQRIISREGKVPPDIEVRMRTAETEMALADRFDRRLVNDHFEVAYGQLKKLIEEFLGAG
jgi:guanylate kinase